MASFTVIIRRITTQTAKIKISATEDSIDSKCDLIISTLSGNLSPDKYGSQTLEWELEDEEFDIDSADEE